MGHKRLSYRRFFERLLCDTKQSLVHVPDDCLSSANSRPSSEQSDEQFYKLLEWLEPVKQTLVIDSSIASST